MAYDINVALERLEKNLQNLQSAKEQVESTVSANDKLQKIVSGYVTTVKSILEETLLLREEVTTMKSQKIEEVKEAAELIGKLCDEIVGAFRNDAKKTLRAFDTENNKLSQAITELKHFQSKLEKSIAVSSSVDTKLDQTSKDVLGLQNVQHKGFSSVSKNIEIEAKNIAQNISEASQSLSEQLSVIKTNTKKIDNLFRDNKALYKDILQVQSAVEDLKVLMVEQYEENHRNININRWILIVGFVVLIGLHFLIR